MTSRELSLRTTTHGFEPSRFSARVNEFTRGDRARRAFRRFLPIFGVACAVVLIPPHLPWISIVTITGAVALNNTVGTTLTIDAETLRAMLLDDAERSVLLPGLVTERRSGAAAKSPACGAV